MKNPYQHWLERIQVVMKEQNASGWVTVRCTGELELHDDTYSDDEYSGESPTYTQQHVDFIRCVILPPERERAVEEMTQLVLGDQYGQSIKMFHPSSFASEVLSAFESMKAKFKNKRMWSKKFNILFGFTLVIKQYNSWVETISAGGMMDEMIDEISTMWAKVMKRSSAELEIDDEFSRPGIGCFLLKFMSILDPE
eukprot:CAMPEP_0181092790 /NCGR_PEP_ID=MMETSP1071-20121207/9100_1 /TAXON_ID=35127 /ORGANISM="Thalassiosira sp., Strain NH16" /LENGTH=195 /DNA_ID=CAMNT_0023174981 /DNA_START=181 /DNA_END=768 /DNA_ORIENTATION=+